MWRGEAAVEHVVRDLFVGLYARTAMADLLTAVDEWRPDLIVRETMEFASAVAAVRYDVPQAFVPLFVDGPANAARVAELGAGVVAGEDLRAAVGLLQRSAAGHAIR